MEATVQQVQAGVEQCRSQGMQNTVAAVGQAPSMATTQVSMRRAVPLSSVLGVAVAGMMLARAFQVVALVMLVVAG
jgi:precorrin isomerase